MRPRVSEAAASYKLTLLRFLGFNDRQIAALCVLNKQSRAYCKSLLL